jgi:hypothetical protein
MPPALETSAARVPLEVPSIGALMIMGCWACGNQVASLLRVSCAISAGWAGLRVIRKIDERSECCKMMLSVSNECP